MTKTQKELLAQIERSTGAYSASDWAFTAAMGNFTYPKFNRRVDAVIDLARMGEIVNHDFGFFHSKKVTCLDCEASK